MSDKSRLRDYLLGALSLGTVMEAFKEAAEAVKDVIVPDPFSEMLDENLRGFVGDKPYATFYFPEAAEYATLVNVVAQRKTGKAPIGTYPLKLEGGRVKGFRSEATTNRHVLLVDRDYGEQRKEAATTEAQRYEPTGVLYVSVNPPRLVPQHQKDAIARDLLRTRRSVTGIFGV